MKNVLYVNENTKNDIAPAAISSKPGNWGSIAAE